MLRIISFINQEETFCSKSFYTEYKLAYCRSGLFFFLHCFLVQVKVIKFHLSNIYPVCTLQALKNIHLEFTYIPLKFYIEKAMYEIFSFLEFSLQMILHSTFFTMNNYFLNSFITKLLKKYRAFFNLFAKIFLVHKKQIPAKLFLCFVFFRN